MRAQYSAAARHAALVSRALRSSVCGSRSLAALLPPASRSSSARKPSAGGGKAARVGTEACTGAGTRTTAGADTAAGAGATASAGAPAAGATRAPAGAGTGAVVDPCLAAAGRANSSEMSTAPASSTGGAIAVTLRPGARPATPTPCDDAPLKIMVTERSSDCRQWPGNSRQDCRSPCAAAAARAICSLGSPLAGPPLPRYFAASDRIFFSCSSHAVQSCGPLSNRFFMFASTLPQARSK